MKRLAGIIIDTPADLGTALADYRTMLGYSRQQLAQQIADAGGGNAATVYAQIYRWETGAADPSASRLGPLLAALGCDLALIPKNEPDEVVLDLEPAPSASTGWPT